MSRFRRMSSLQTSAAVHNHFNRGRHLTGRETYEETLGSAHRGALSHGLRLAFSVQPG